VDRTTDRPSATAFREDVALLSRLIRGEHEAFVAPLVADKERLKRFARFVGSSGLRTFVHRELAASPVRAMLPKWWIDQLEQVHATRAAAQVRLVRELDDLAARLGEAGHDFILLKGPYSATRFYGALDRREFADLDILIQRRDLAPVERLLLNAGYTRKSRVIVNSALTSRFTHALDFVKEGAAVDLHWVLSANAAHALDYDAVWRDRQRFTVHGREYAVLSDEYEVVFSLISIFKDLERGAARLKAFVDLQFILLALDGRLDWQRFLENRRREKLRRVSVSVLALFLDLFQCADRLPNVTAAVTSHRLETASVGAAELMSAPRGALRNKLWAADYYECSRLQVFLWWLVSLPFRVAVHAPTGRKPRWLYSGDTVR
jgi:hypothetical protein